MKWFRLDKTRLMSHWGVTHRLHLRYCISIFLPLFLSCLIKEAYGTPRISVILNPHLRDAEISYEAKRGRFIFTAFVMGDLGEVIADAQVTLSHQCFGDARGVSSFSGQVYIEVPFVKNQFDYRECTDHFKARDLLVEQAFQLAQSTTLAERNGWQQTTPIPPPAQSELGVYVTIGATPISSERSMLHIFHTSNDFISIKLSPMKEVSHRILPDLLSINLELRWNRRAVRTLQNREFNAELILDPLQPNGETTQIKGGLIKLSPVDLGQETILQVPLQSYGSYQVQIRVYEEDELVFSALRKTISFIPIYQLEVDELSSRFLSEQFTLSAQLTPLGASPIPPDKFYLPQVEFSWRIQDLGAEFHPEAPAEVSWQIVSLAHFEDGRWSRTIRLPSQNRAQLRLQLFTYSGLSENAELLPYGDPYLSPWLSPPSSWWRAIFWPAFTLLLLILSQRRRKVKKPLERFISKPDDLKPMEGGWLSPDDLSATQSDLNPLERGQVRLLIFDALHRKPISGLITLVRPPPIFDLPALTRRESNFHSVQSWTVTERGVVLSIKTLDDTSDKLSLWVKAEGYEALLSPIIYAEGHSRGQPILALPLWPTREAIGRQWSACLQLLGIETGYGRGDVKNLTLLLKKLRDQDLIDLQAQIEQFLYHPQEGSSLQAIQLTQAICSLLNQRSLGHKIDHLLPPSDLQRRRITP